MPGRNDKKVAVLIPCYNEAGTIEKVIRDYRGVLPDADIYVYDNNSTDGTDETAARAGAIVRHEYKQGKGNVIRTMFREIEADCYLMIDGDDTYPAENAPDMVRPYPGEKGGYGEWGQTVVHLFYRKQTSVPQSGQCHGPRPDQSPVSHQGQRHYDRVPGLSAGIL